MKHTCAQKKKKKKKNGSFIGYRCSKNRNCLKSHPVAPPWENLFSVWLRPLNKNVIAALFKCPNLQITKTSVFHRNGWMGYNVLPEKNDLWWPKAALVCFISIILNTSLYFATSHLHKCPQRPNKFMESEVRRVLAFLGSWGCLGRAVRLWMLQCCYLSLDACQTEERCIARWHLIELPDSDFCTSRYIRSASSLLVSLFGHFLRDRAFKSTYLWDRSYSNHHRKGLA